MTEQRRQIPFPSGLCLEENHNPAPHYFHCPRTQISQGLRWICDQEPYRLPFQNQALTSLSANHEQLRAELPAGPKNAGHQLGNPLGPRRDDEHECQTGMCRQGVSHGAGGW